MIINGDLELHLRNQITCKRNVVLGERWLTWGEMTECIKAWIANPIGVLS